MIVKSSFIGIAYNYAICYLYNLMDNARKKRKYRAIVACLLLLTMMPFFFVKAFHVHKERACIHDGQQLPHHDSADECAICLFTLSLFTEAESLEYTHTLTVKPVKYLILEEQDVTVTVLLLSLRAPPVRMS